jgi:DNA-damage-inducible protein D
MNEKELTTGHDSPFERIRKTNAAGAEYWPSRDFADVLGYTRLRQFAE